MNRGDHRQRTGRACAALRFGEPSSAKAHGDASRPGAVPPECLAAVLALCLALQASPAASTEGDDADDQLGAIAVVSGVIAAVQTASPADPDEAAGAVRDSFDIEAIAKTIAGKSWSTATGRQKTEFKDALLSATVANIFERLKERRDLPVDIGKVRGLANGDTLVSTRLTKLDGRVVRLDWRLRPCPAGLCVVDLIVDGASMAIELRDEAAAILSANGGAIGELSLRLRARPAHPFN